MKSFVKDLFGESLCICVDENMPQCAFRGQRTQVNPGEQTQGTKSVDSAFTPRATSGPVIIFQICDIYVCNIYLSRISYFLTFVDKRELAVI